MNTLTRFTVLAVFVLSTLPASAATVPLAKLPQAIRVGAFTVTVRSASWASPPNAQWSHDPEKALSVEYSVVRTSDGTAITGPDSRRYLQMRAYAPGHQTRWAFARIQDGTSAAFTGIDATEPLFKIDMLIQDPNATPQQLGEATNDGAIAGMPINPALTTAQPVSKRFFTLFGATCQVNSITIQKATPKTPAQTFLDCTVEPPEDDTDTEYSLNGALSLADNRGRAIGDKRGGAMRKGPNHWTLMFGGVPEADATSLTVKFALTETSPSHRDSATVAHGSFAIAASMVTKPKRVGTISSLASATSGTLTAYLDRYHRWNDTAGVARAWIFDAKDAGAVEWDLEKVLARFSPPPAGETGLGVQEQQYWLLNSTPANSRMAGYNIYVNAPKGAQSNKPLQLALTAVPVTRSEGDLPFSEIAIPGPTSATKPNAHPDGNDDSQLVLRRVAAVKPEAPNTAASGLATVRLSGLALVLDYPVVTNGSVDIKLLSASDNKGGWLMPRQLTVSDATLIRPSSITGRQEYVFLVTRPASDADTFNTVFHIVRKARTGAAQTVVIPDTDKLIETE
ncbi:MAG TPA: hypothetical protein VGK19_01600 [Capsulimonadaceae bacterium]|jgi:hypothetical protein